MTTLTEEERKQLAATSEERFRRDREELKADLIALQKMIEADAERFAKEKKRTSAKSPS